MDALLQDLRFAARTLARSPGFTAVTVVTLGLGIGASVAMFSVLNGVLFRGTGFPHAERLVSVGSAPPEDRDRFAPDASGSTSPLAAFDAWRSAADVVEAGGVALGGAPILSGRDEARRIEAWSVSSSFLQLLGGRAAVGRLLDAQDDSVGAPRVAVLSNDFWRSSFGADSSVIGRTITLDTVRFAVVGVAAAGVRYPEGAQIWTGLGAELDGSHGPNLRQEWRAQVILRLHPDVDLARARESLDRVTKAAVAAGALRTPLLPVVRSLPRVLQGNLRTPLTVLTAGVLALLLIAAVNVAALLTARGVARAPELALRFTLGASRFRVVRLVLTECAVLVAIGTTAGVGIATWGVPLLKALAGTELPEVFQVRIDFPALAAAIGLALLAGCAAGLAPALVAAHRSNAELHIGTRATEGTAKRRVLDLLLCSQVSLTVMLVVGAALLGRTLARLQHVDVGFAVDRVVAADLWLPSYRYPDSRSRVAFVSALTDRLQHLPGVRAAAVSTGIPFGGGDLTTEVAADGRPVKGALTWIAAVTDNYFASLEIPILRGAADLHRSDAIIIDSTAARAFFPSVDPLGKRVTYEDTFTGIVVGIAGAVRQDQLRELPPSHIYAPFASYAQPYLHVVARGSTSPQAIATEIRDAIHTLDPAQPIERLGVLRERMTASFARERFVGVMLGIFAMLSLTLAVSGIYGAASFAVERRRREIAVRIAIGAIGRDVIVALLGRTLLLVGLGIACGGVAALAASRILGSMLYDVSRADPVSYAIMVGATLSVVIAAIWLPALKATRVDPMTTLRAE